MIPMLPIKRHDAGEWARLRTMRVDGDYMSPTIPRGAVVGVLPADTYHAEGLYVVTQLGVPQVRRAQKMIGVPQVRRAQKMIGEPVVRLSFDNPAYVPVTISLDEFHEILLGRVVALFTVLDPVRLPI